MLYLRFSIEDLGRTTFAHQPSPLVEAGLALAMLQRRDQLFRPWRRRIARQLPRTAAALLELIPPSGAGPLFLDPPAAELEDGITLVRSTAAQRVREELRRVVPAQRPLTPFIRALYQRDQEAWTDLERALRSAHRALIAEPWHRLCGTLESDVARRAQVTAREGLRATLTGLVPGSQWRENTLCIPSARDRQIDLQGKGLILQPSAYWTGRVLTTYDGFSGRLLLVYPAMTALPLTAESGEAGSLGTLLGQTRAAVLQLSVTPHTTTQLAREIGTSLASASQHAAVLRSAGLLTTRREGKAVLHTITPLGLQLVHGQWSDRESTI